MAGTQAQEEKPSFEQYINDFKIEAMEKGFEMFQIIREKGVSGIWEYIKEQFTDLKETIIEFFDAFHKQDTTKLKAMVKGDIKLQSISVNKEKVEWQKDIHLIVYLKSVNFLIIRAAKIFTKSKKS